MGGIKINEKLKTKKVIFCDLEYDKKCKYRQQQKSTSQIFL